MLDEEQANKNESVETDEEQTKPHIVSYLHHIWKKYTIYILSAASILLILVVSGGWFIWNTMNDTILPAGYRVFGLDAKGMKPEQLRERMQRRIQSWEQTKIVFIPDRTDATLNNLASHSLTLKELGISFSSEKVEQQLEDWSNGGLWKRLQLKGELPTQNVSGSITVDQEQLWQTMSHTYGEVINRKPKDAEVRYDAPLNPSYVKEKDGIELDAFQLKQQLTEQVSKYVLNKQEQARLLMLRMPLITVPANVTLSTLQARKPNALLAEYTTRIADSGKGHYHNIEASAKVLNGLVLRPGQRVRYQDIADKTEQKYGLQEAPVIEKGKLIEGIGGGLCQTSTTMYNAALKSGLQIVERQSHSLPVGYVPLGLDATYSDNGPDLVVRNNTEGDVVWVSRVEDHKLTIRLYGQKEPGTTYQIETRLVKETEPASVYEFKDVTKEKQTHVLQKGRAGYVLETYRIKLVNGIAVAREKLHNSVYRSQPTHYTMEKTQFAHTPTTP
ncbi:VanW family protein [Paenibacillus sp. ACRRX]|uniref:VanW family protein n=1 Tax=unclassified Paenibacillus TaxID=185978 RepID=UPI001EF6D1B1|nr:MULTISPECIES: VanW family protein [unclassified Paenibacillus]MCG7408095.1 VanW family protein [Paenibacillus sp. ACRRX]MDK8181522.1 VanW family protein [Paenibacillus sp. UMB4589-SE434]